MFEFLYLGQVFKVIDDHPKESLAALAIVTTGYTVAHIKGEKIRAEAKVKTEEIRLECEKIRLETARVEAQNRAS